MLVPLLFYLTKGTFGFKMPLILMPDLNLRSRTMKIARSSCKEIIVTAPPAKAYTLRAILLSALARGTSEVINPLLAAVDSLYRRTRKIGYRYSAQKRPSGDYRLRREIQTGGGHSEPW